ncbi:DUF7305 domain-containing protein [Sporosarcina ureae]|uniref:Type 4 fimbrial biogenesis protein PilX N-terminal domain-containing protein n=1 Tax=Sporosarcina ureae TaxID=1571 RepID=A0ABM6JSJ7_SPOUR|nr:PilX N-terminal domain-containing pilus assembly protein [Sporosarcina ureae]ARF13104.1 hypothetical protein SporoS204_02255 [Sporosarcina ureae]
MRNDKGYTLVVVLMVLVVMAVLGTSIIGLSLNNSKMTRGEQDDQSVFYIAESGVNYTLARINEIATATASQFTKADDEANFFQAVSEKVRLAGIEDDTKNQQFENLYGEKPEIINVEIKRGIDRNISKYEIRSTGRIGGKVRTVSQIITLNYEILPGIGTGQGGNSGNGDVGTGTSTSFPAIKVPDGTAVFVNGKISISGGAIINGSIGTNLTDNKSITLSGGPKISGNIFVPVGSEKGALDKPNSMTISVPIGMEESGIMKLPEFPEYPSYKKPSDVTIGDQYKRKDVIKDGGVYADNYVSNNYTLNIDGNMYLTTIKVDGNNTLKINVGDKDRVIVVDHLDVLQGKIEIIGTGKLTLMVKDKINVKGSIGNSGSANQLGIFFEGSTTKEPKKVKFDNETQINGSFYAKDADIELTGGGGIKGNILTGGKEVKVSGGVKADPTLILAPNAAVNISGGGNISGAIYAGSFTADGGASVTFKQPNIGAVPIGPGTNKPDPVVPDNTLITPPHITRGEFKEI